MNKEFIGKKRFYLYEHPEVYIDARVFVVETRNSEYFTAILEDGNAYRIEFLKPLCEDLPDMESFTDLEGRLFIEFAAKTIKNVRFYDRKSNEIGLGELTAVKIRNELAYVGDITPNRSFKYKCNGWDYEAGDGEQLVVLMQKDVETATVMPLIMTVFGRNDKVKMEVLKNSYFQIHCMIPDIPNF